MAKVRRYSSMPLPISINTFFACAIASPLPGDTVTQGTPVAITGTISKGAVVVQVKLGATVLGSASIVGLTWSFSWTPQVGDVGAQTINVVATSASAEVATAPGVAVTVASSAFSGDFAALAVSYGLAVRADYRGDMGVSGTQGSGKAAWANQTGDYSAMGFGASTNGIGTVGAGLNSKASVITNGVSQWGIYTAPSAVAPATTNSHIWSIERYPSAPASVGYMHSANGVTLNQAASQANPAANVSLTCGSAGPTTTGVVLNQWYRSRASFVGGGANADLLRIGAHAPAGIATSNTTAGLTWGWGAAFNGSVPCPMESLRMMRLEGPVAAFLLFDADAAVKAQSFWTNAIEI